MRLLAVCSLLVLASPAIAQPAPAGTCRLDEGLVAQLAPPLSPGEETPRVISMPLPRMGNTIVDISFRIGTDGTATDLKILCQSPSNPNLGEILGKAVKNWKFAPMKRLGKATVFDASYRISASGVVPLNFQSEKTRPIQG